MSGTYLYELEAARMKDSAEPHGTPWKWDTTLLDREGWKSDPDGRGGDSLRKLPDGTIVVRLKSMFEAGVYTDWFVQKLETLTICSKDNGLSWQGYSGPPLYDAAELSDGTLIELPICGAWSARLDEMKALVKDRLGLKDEHLSMSAFRADLWPASARRDLEKKGYHVRQVSQLANVVAIVPEVTVRRSFDRGKTWDYKRMEGYSDYAYLREHKKGLVLCDDTVVVGAYAKHNREDTFGCYVLRSTDRGESWELCPIAVDPTRANEFLEPNLLQLPDGRLLAMMIHIRPGPDGLADPLSREWYLSESESDDAGITWSKPVNTPIWGGPADLLLLRSGNILCTYSHRRRPFGIRGCLSRDQGRSWDIDNEIIIRDDSRQGGPVGAPVSIQANDGTILTLYGTSRTGRVKPKSPYRWYGDDAHCFIGLSRYTEDYVRARGQSQPPKERKDTPPQSENTLDSPPPDN